MDPATKWLIRAVCGVVIATGVLTMHADSNNRQREQEDQAQKWAGKNQASEEHA